MRNATSTPGRFVLVVRRAYVAAWFEIGEIVARDRIVAAREERLAAGKIIREARKETMVELIRLAPERTNSAYPRRG